MLCDGANVPGREKSPKKVYRHIPERKTSETLPLGWKKEPAIRFGGNKTDRSFPSALPSSHFFPKYLYLSINFLLMSFSVCVDKEPRKPGREERKQSSKNLPRLKESTRLIHNPN